MDGLPTGVPITLVVKAPNQKVGDQTIECFLDWTVKRLKTHLSAVYPNKPTEKNQRIIYSGKLLQDSVVLRDVLRQHDDTRQHTVHLVCSSLSDDSSSNYTSNPAERNSTHSSSSESNSSTPSSRRSSTSTTPNNNDGLRHRMNSGVSYQNYYQQYPYPSYPMQYGQQQQAYMPNAQQAYWMQQMYAQQMAQYMQYSMQHSATASMLHTNVPPPATPPAVPQPAAANLGAPQGPVNQGAPAPPPAPNPAAPANQNMRMNAGVGAAPVDDDEQEGGNRDWLDWIYTFCRMGVLLSIVYFYSSLNRFLVVISAMIFIYLYQGGWFQLQRGRPGVREVQEAPDGDQQDQDNHAGEDNPDGNQDNTADSQEETDEATEGEEVEAEPATPQEPPRPGVLATAWIFVSTFFTSLLPLDPAANNMAN